MSTVSKKSYTKDDLELALVKIKNGMPIKVASRTFSIPRGTLQNRVHNRTKKSVNRSGPAPVLTAEEEKAIVDWIDENMKRGFPKRYGDMIFAVKEFLDNCPRPNPFKDNLPGRSWYNSFLQRNPKVSLRQPESVTDASSKVSESDIRRWFKQIDDYCVEMKWEEALKDPTRIYNADETGFQLCPKTGKVLAIKGSRNVYEVDRGNEKENITTLLTFSAAGHVVRPLIVYPYKRIPNDIRESVPRGYDIDKTDNGWMTRDVFFDFVKNTFYPDLVANNIEFPVIFFVDGHVTHMSLSLSQLCNDLQIILVCLYPNSTRMLQPCDVSIFGPLKAKWKQTVEIWKRQFPELTFTKLRFASVLKIVIDEFVTSESIVNGFRTTGLYPFDPNAIDYSKCLGSSSVVSTTTSDKEENAAVHTTETLSTAIDLMRFKEIVGPTKLAELSEFNGSEGSASVEFLLLRGMLEELSSSFAETEAIIGSAVDDGDGNEKDLAGKGFEIVSDGDDNETVSDGDENVTISNGDVNEVGWDGDGNVIGLDEADNEATTAATHDSSNEMNDELTVIDLADSINFASDRRSCTLAIGENIDEKEVNTQNGLENCDTKKVESIVDVLAIHPKPKKNTLKQTFLISSELWRMEENLKEAKKLAELKALEERKEIRIEKQKQKKESLEAKKQERAEIAQKKAAEKEVLKLAKEKLKNEKARKRLMDSEQKEREKKAKKKKITKQVANSATPEESPSPKCMECGQQVIGSNKYCTACIAKIVGL